MNQTKDKYLTIRIDAKTKTEFLNKVEQYNLKASKVGYLLIRDFIKHGFKVFE
jgi:antitoxin component of RelBE/YafQ-DinJ toxin-antitoxin module